MRKKNLHLNAGPWKTNTWGEGHSGVSVGLLKRTEKRRPIPKNKECGKANDVRNEGRPEPSRALAQYVLEKKSGPTDRGSREEGIVVYSGLGDQKT